RLCGTLGRFYGVDQQHGDGHGADASGYGRDGTRHFTSRVEFDIAGQLAISLAVDANINHNCSRLDHVTGNHVGAAGGHHQYVGPARVCSEVAGLGVAQGDRCTLGKHEQGHGLAHDIARTNHNGLCPPQVDTLGLEHLHDAVGSTRLEQGSACHQQAGVADMESVDVFFGRDCFDDLGGVQMLRQRKLDQNTVHGSVFIELLHHIEQLLLGNSGIEPDDLRVKTRLFTCGGLVSNIYLRCRIFADQYDSKARYDATFAKGLSAFCDIGLDGIRQRLAVDNACGHACPR